VVFPHLTGVLIDPVERTGAGLVIAGRATGATAAYWACGTVASRVHSRYRRSIGDVAAAGLPVRVELVVRRLCCPAAGCPKVTFAEQVPGLTVRYGRRSPLAVFGQLHGIVGEQPGDREAFFAASVHRWAVQVSIPSVAPAHEPGNPGNCWVPSGPGDNRDGPGHRK
jgi:hypothetical protein